ncbi:calcium-binding protein [Mesobacterium pallidum]|uniref:calcium-binding protein n=1 Tax=Mesobacterium pallidum TaxID=2872037 RepID=UPI001EE27427|nr:calcium-binding protein [Mesobacterium pallidum]
MATPINIENVQDWDEPLLTDPLFTSSHVFSTADITVTFGGMTIGNAANPLSVFDTTGASGTKIADGVTLYPIDSEFGYYVEDFTDASVKVLDGDYAEGWAGDLMIAGVQAGLVLSDSPTDTFKTPALLGTWLAGLGGNTVKASTEHYVVMQNVLSDQRYPGDPDALYPLDNDLFVIGGDYDGMAMVDAIALAGDANGDGVADIKDVLAPNETEISHNIAASTDYSVTVKDDGKLLYRWGNTIKKPNDLRMEATLDLPDEWDDRDEGTGVRKLFQVTASELVVHHSITNNPNDQVRPEDFENEAAIGTLPTYEIISDYSDPAEPEKGTREVWVTTDDYYSGDGTLYPAGTILKDAWMADQWAAGDLAAIGAGDGAAGFTNAWYTTMDREPFEPVLNEDGTAYEGSGPRWRLQSDKYGQDLPSVVIPADPSLPPPPTQDEVKYDVGSETQTVLNMLDWGAPAVPLSISAGWQDKPGEVSINGMNYSSGFDMAVYIKGDIKPATIYSAELLVDYEEIALHDAGDTIMGTAGDDYLVGLGSNTFTGGSGSDLMVLTYGSSVSGVLTASTITDFTLGEDAIGLINLGVTDTNFDFRISQMVVGGDLQIWLDADGVHLAETPELIATLTGITTELELGEDFLLANPGAGENPSVTPVVGTADADTLIGTEGDDLIQAFAGDDLVTALGGDDTVMAGAGADTVDAGTGDDVVFGGLGADDIVLNSGNDVFYDTAEFGVEGSDTVTGGAGDDEIYGGGGADLFLGGLGNDFIQGGKGDDTIYAGDGVDEIYANDGNDMVTGGLGSDYAILGIGFDTWIDSDDATGDDTVFGGGGADTIGSLAGDDVLTGGVGADSFVFGAAMGDVTITDFVLAEDALTFDAALWAGALDQATLDARSAVVDGALVLTLDTGATLTFDSLAVNTGLLDDILVA